MKKYLYIATLFLGGSALLFGETTEWKSYTIESGKFSIEMPGLPEETSETIKADIGDIPLQSLTYELNDITFTVNMVTYPVGFMADKDPEVLFDNIRNATVKSRKGEITEEKKQKFKGFPSRLVRLRLDEANQQVNIVLVLVKNRLYQVLTTAPAAQEDPVIEKFLTSFKLDENAGQNELDEYLKKLGLKYEVDKDGQYNFTLVFQDNRSQLVFITPVQLDYDSKQHYDIWSPVAKFQKEIPPEVATQLLYENAQVEIGTYQVLNTSSGKLVVFSTKVASGLDTETFKRMIVRISSIADDAEKHITQEDEY